MRNTSLRLKLLAWRVVVFFHGVDPLGIILEPGEDFPSMAAEIECWSRLFDELKQAQYEELYDIFFEIHL